MSVQHEKIIPGDAPFHPSDPKEDARHMMESDSCTRHPQVQIPFLGARQPFPEPTDLLQAGPEMQWRRCLQQMVGLEAEAHRVFLSITIIWTDCSSRAVAQRHYFPITEHHGSRKTHGNRNLLCQLIREKNIVGVKELDELPLGKLEPAVSRGTPAPVRAGLPADAGSKRSNDVETAVCRAIIDDDDLFVRVGLLQGTPYRIGDVMDGVVAGNDNGDGK